MKNSSAENAHDEQGYSDDDSDLKEVHNRPAKEVEKKLRMSLEKEFNKCFKNWIELVRGIRWNEEFPELEKSNYSKDNLEHLLQVDMGNALHKITKSDLTRKKHGSLPKMVTASKG